MIVGLHFMLQFIFAAAAQINLQLQCKWSPEVYAHYYVDGKHCR